jgi:hypothetical protein
MSRARPAERPPGARLAIAAYCAVLVLPPLLLRGLVLAEKGLVPTALDLRGAASDLFVGLALAGLGLLLQRLGRGLTLLAAIAWLAAAFANYEHVRYFDALGSLAHAGYLADPTFLRGSALAVSHPWLLAGSFAAAVAGVWFLGRAWKGWQAAGALAGAGLAGLAVLTLWPQDAGRAAWRQTNAVGSNLLALARPGREPERLARVLPAARGLLRPDLSGQPRVKLPATGRPNVLLLILESATGAFLPSIAAHHGIVSPIRMPRLDALAQQGWSYVSFVNQQRQTNRGEYALLCGDLPKLVSEESKMTEYVHQGVHPCLPELLRQAGYRTVYLQAAPLAFMLKDQFMPRAGFDESHGSTYFHSPHHASIWGVDDQTLFDGALQMVRGLAGSRQPWFLTLLTLSTHHPYVVPPDFQPEGPQPADPAARAFAYMDRAAAGFIEKLQGEGLLDETLLLVTSDESLGLREGMDDTQALLSQSWGLLLVFPPGGLAPPGKSVGEVFVQSDLALSVVDFLGLGGTTQDLAGRSVFRLYEQPRTVMAANTYSRQVLALAPDDIVTICAESAQPSGCVHVQTDRARPFSGSLRRVEPADAAARIDELAAVVEASRLFPRSAGVEASAYQLIREADTPIDTEHADGQLFFAGQYLDVPAGRTLLVDLDFELLGEGTALAVHHSLVQAEENLYSPILPLIESGQSFHLQYSYTSTKPLRELQVRMYVEVLRPGKDPVLRFHEASLEIQPAASQRPGLKLLDFRRFVR